MAHVNKDYIENELKHLELVLDNEIDFLTANPEEIPDSWTRSTPLFDFLMPKTGVNEGSCGCLVHIRLSPKITGDVAWLDFDNKVIDHELTERIKNDTRIPCSRATIRVKHLPVFKEYQLEYRRRLLEYQEKQHDTNIT